MELPLASLILRSDTGTMIDISPLRKSRDYRFLYLGQLTSFFGAMVASVALPYQIYHLTGSTAAVGLIGLVQLGPMVFAGLYGGALADVLERRKVLFWTELGLMVTSLILGLNAHAESPSVPLIFAMAGLSSLLYGIHRPSHEALTPKLVEREDLTAVGALSSLRGNIAMIGGPALGGVIIAGAGVWSVYWFEMACFTVSLLCLWNIRRLPPPEGQFQRPGLSSIVEGLRYAGGRQDLMGTYLVDFIAMVFAMPNALYPALANSFGGPKVLGALYAAPSIGALGATLLSSFMKKWTRHGQIIMVSAALWGVSITLAGFMTSLPFLLFFLGLAGAFDMVSGVFRSRIWNETIPDRLRGRMAGVEMISYLAGPQVGSAQVGFSASLVGIPWTFRLGGLLCVAGVGICAWRLPVFRTYDADEAVRRHHGT